MVDTFKIKKSDTQPAIEATLEYNNGSAVDLTGADIFFVMGNLTDYTTYRSGACVITGSDTGKCKYNWTALDTGSVGNYWGEFEVNWGSGSVMTLPNSHNLKIEVYEDYN